MLDLSIEGPVARLRLERPERRNAIPVAGWTAIASACGQAAEAGARVLLLSAAGDAFCAGADLGEFAALTGDEDAVRAFREAMRAGIEALADCAFPVVALIEGACYGAAVALIAACDIRIAGPAARFAITPARLGISFPQPDVARLVALVGRGQASRLLLSARPIDAVEAARIGLVDLAGPDPEAAAADLAEAIAGNSAESVALLKRAIASAAAGTSGEQSFDAAFDARFASSDFAVRLRALRGGA